jgi:ATP-dependent Lon protease
LLPNENAKDIPELPERIREDLELIIVSNLDDVLAIALLEGDEPPFGVGGGESSEGMPLPQVSGGNGSSDQPIRASSWRPE